MSDVILEMTEKMEKSVEMFKVELSKIRTGRASLALLDGIMVDAYGSSMPLNQVGTLTIPESRLIAIQPWDPQLLPVIEKALLKAMQISSVFRFSSDFCLRRCSLYF